MKQTGNWMRTSLYDMLQQPFAVGDKVVRAIVSGRATNIEIATVTRLEEDRLYLNDSRVAVNYPGRLLIVNKLFEP